ncbi:hypothetical protein E0L31_026910, partial [Serratia marcescens]|nr:hypothetical protein [Serratia marcescens]
MKQTLTTERLKDLTFHRSKLIFPASHEEAAAMARELLANREAQPVGYTSKRNLANVTGRHLELFSKDSAVYSDPVALYTAPPAPAVPGELLDAMEEVIRISDRDHEAWDKAKAAITACRAAMLNHVGDTNEKAAEKCECSSIDYCENCLRAMLAQPVSSGYKFP